MARLRVGTSGWSYPEWRGLVYPPRLGSGRWLQFYATLFDTVEVNASFYRLLKRPAVARWRRETPDDFLFALKGSRFITHMLKLTRPELALRRYFAPLAPLGAKAGPVVFQTPLAFTADAARLEAFLAALPPGRRYAFEFRHASWHVPAVLRLLRRHNAAFVPFEIGRLRGPRLVTADFVYVRLHGRKPGYRGDYTRRALADWATWVRGQLARGRDAYVYFDNTAERDSAVRNAQQLRALVAAGARRGAAAARAPRRIGAAGTSRAGVAL
jgi:uncharacterized protein YecE (DUF72 family)